MAGRSPSTLAVGWGLFFLFNVQSGHPPCEVMGLGDGKDLLYEAIQPIPQSQLTPRYAFQSSGQFLSNESTDGVSTSPQREQGGLSGAAVCSQQRLVTASPAQVQCPICHSPSAVHTCTCSGWVPQIWKAILQSRPQCVELVHMVSSYEPHCSGKVGESYCLGLLPPVLFFVGQTQSTRQCPCHWRPAL